MNGKDKIEVFAADTGTRASGSKTLNVSQLSANVKLFLEQMGSLIDNTPPSLGSLQFVEFEVHADVTAKGTLALLGTGGEAGAAGGLKFIFRRVPGKSE